MSLSHFRYTDVDGIRRNASADTLGMAICAAPSGYISEAVIGGEDCIDDHMTLSPSIRPRFRNVTFEQLNMTLCDLRGALLDDCTFSGCNMTKADMSNSEQHRSSYQSCEMRNSRFIEASLDCCVFSRCDMFGARFYGTEFNGCAFPMTSILGPVLRCCDLMGVDFHDAIGVLSSHDAISAILAKAHICSTSASITRRACIEYIRLRRDACWSEFAGLFDDEYLAFAYENLKEYYDVNAELKPDDGLLLLRDAWRSHYRKGEEEESEKPRGG